MPESQQIESPEPRSSLTADSLRDAVLATLDEMKGEDTVTIDLAGKSDVASFMIISSGQSTTKVGAMAQEVRKVLKDLGAEILGVDGIAHKDWVLIDANACIVHLFRPPVREFYNLEKLWGPGTAAFSAAPTRQHPLDIESLIDDDTVHVE